MMHYVIVNEWMDEDKGAVSILDVVHSPEEAEIVFGKYVANEKQYAENHGFKIYEDSNTVFDAGEEGYYVSNHTRLYIEVVKQRYEMSKMIFESPSGAKVVFDDFTDNTEEYGSYWVEMCSRCYEKYGAFLELRVDESGSACGTCSVEGCEHQADYYVDFDEREVRFCFE